MAVEIYKAGNGSVVDGVKCDIARVDPSRLQAHLDMGYVLDVSELYPDEEKADTDGDGELSNKEIREAAKVAGIDGWETARIAKLKEALGYDAEG